MHNTSCFHSFVHLFKFAHNKSENWSPQNNCWEQQKMKSPISITHIRHFEATAFHANWINLLNLLNFAESQFWWWDAIKWISVKMGNWKISLILFHSFHFSKNPERTFFEFTENLPSLFGIGKFVILFVNEMKIRLKMTMGFHWIQKMCTVDFRNASFLFNMHLLQSFWTSKGSIKFWCAQYVVSNLIHSKRVEYCEALVTVECNNIRINGIYEKFKGFT